MALADKFCGKVQQEEFVQQMALEWLPGRTLTTGKFMRQVFRFDGCTFSEAHGTDSVTVTDLAEQSYTFTPDSSFVDSSTSTGVFPKEVVEVTRARVSPGMWTLTVTRTGGAIYQNGTIIRNGPDWTGYTGEES